MFVSTSCSACGQALADYSEAIRLEPENATYLHHKALLLNLVILQ